MAAHHDVESVTNIMENYSIGTVSHVDFTPINQKPGFNENNTDNNLKSAFVHFSDPSPVNNDNYHYSSKITIGNTKFCSRFTIGNANFWNIVLYSNGPYKLQVSTREFWLCLENKNPVQRTMMNIHQVVENSRHLENLIEKQAEKLKEQEETIKILDNKLENVRGVISQLLSGLFNHKSQYEVLKTYNDNLFLGLNEIEEPDYYSNWENCPTTRQGDDSERRIEALEQTVREMLNFDCSEAVFTPQEHDEEDDLSVSTHSSMPELEEVSVDSEERIRNSFELCGNE